MAAVLDTGTTFLVSGVLSAEYQRDGERARNIRGRIEEFARGTASHVFDAWIGVHIREPGGIFDKRAIARRGGEGRRKEHRARRIFQSSVRARVEFVFTDIQ